VLSENWVAHAHAGSGSDQAVPEQRVALPRRQGLPPTKGTLPVCAAVVGAWGGAAWSVLVQSEYGDVYRVGMGQGAQGLTLRVGYLDTVVRCNALVASPPARPTVLWGAAEFGDHALWLLEKGDGADEMEVEGEGQGGGPAAVEGDGSQAAAQVAAQFKPRPGEGEEPRHLQAVSEQASLAPIVRLAVDPHHAWRKKETLVLCGRGPRSSLRILSRGLKVDDTGCAAAVPPNGQGLWALWPHLILSRSDNTTQVYALEEGPGGAALTLLDPAPMGYQTRARTLEVGELGPLGPVQVTPSGVHRLRPPALLWSLGGRREMIAATVAGARVVLAWGTELTYLEVQGQALVERGNRDVHMEISTLYLSADARDPLLLVGAWDNTLRVMVVAASGVMDEIQRLHLSDRPVSIQLLGPEGPMMVGVNSGELYIFEKPAGSGLHSQWTSSTRRQLGTAHARLVPLTVQGAPAVLALSSESWLFYTHNGQPREEPLSWASDVKPSLGAAFAVVPEGFAAVFGQRLEVVSIRDYGSGFSEDAYPLACTPRAVVSLPPAWAGEGAERMAVLESEQQGATWAAGIRVLDLASGETVQRLDLPAGEAALAMELTRFAVDGGASVDCLVVGVAEALSPSPEKRTHGRCHLAVYGWDRAGARLALLHRTEVEQPPRALHAVEEVGRLLVAVGGRLRVYSMGKKKLLKRCEASGRVTQIVRVQHCQNRVFVADALTGIHVLLYK
jgi:splicing factor 3B subunit 3